MQNSTPERFHGRKSRRQGKYECAIQSSELPTYRELPLHHHFRSLISPWNYAPVIPEELSAVLNREGRDELEDVRHCEVNFKYRSLTTHDYARGIRQTCPLRTAQSGAGAHQS